jgi:hypothetical protein
MSTHMLTTNRDIENDNQILYKFMFCLILNSSISKSLCLYLVFATVCRIWNEMCFVLQFLHHEHSFKSKPKGSSKQHSWSACSGVVCRDLFFVQCRWFDTGIVTETHRCDFSTAYTSSSSDVTVSPIIWILLVFSPCGCSTIKCVLHLTV